ncbi:MAG TPA: 6,7-dimethyl-8-ribityllumazine synthase [Candidatus Peribacteraceae bacterium]|nr:6,7-dimethyl-8-ribityllumazine synthase [Candidatus Peribacteraceae bacterium]
MKKEVSHSLPATINPDWRVGIVAARYYKEETDALVDGARNALLEAGLKPENVTAHFAPGSFEIPLIGAALAESDKVDALIGIGIIVEGDTHHARLLAEAATQGIMETQLTYQLPFAFEVLYVDSLELARARTEGPHNKGTEAANAVLHALAALEGIRND